MQWPIDVTISETNNTFINKLNGASWRVEAVRILDEGGNVVLYINDPMKTFHIYLYK